MVEYNSRFMDLFHVTGELYGKKIEEVPGTGELLTYIEKRKSYRNKLIMYPAGKASLVFNMECIIKEIMNKFLPYMPIEKRRIKDTKQTS